MLEFADQCQYDGPYRYFSGNAIIIGYVVGIVAACVAVVAYVVVDYNGVHVSNIVVLVVVRAIAEVHASVTFSSCGVCCHNLLLLIWFLFVVVVVAVAVKCLLILCLLLLSLLRLLLLLLLLLSKLMIRILIVMFPNAQESGNGNVG